MAIDKKYIDQFINVTSKAAIASSFLVGKKDKTAADQAAVDSMRTELNKIDMTGEIVCAVYECDWINDNWQTNCRHSWTLTGGEHD